MTGSIPLFVKYSLSYTNLYRLSGTGTVGATIRTYIERYETKDLLEDPEIMLNDLSNISRQIADIPNRTGKTKPDIIT